MLINDAVHSLLLLLLLQNLHYHLGRHRPQLSRQNRWQTLITKRLLSLFTLSLASKPGLLLHSDRLHQLMHNSLSLKASAIMANITIHFLPPIILADGWQLLFIILQFPPQRYIMKIFHFLIHTIPSLYPLNLVYSRQVSRSGHRDAQLFLAVEF